MSTDISKFLALTGENKAVRRKKKRGALPFLVAIILLGGLSGGGYYLATNEAARESLSALVGGNVAGASAENDGDASLFPAEPKPEKKSLWTATSTGQDRPPAAGAKAVRSGSEEPSAPPAFSTMSQPHAVIDNGVSKVPRAEVSRKQLQKSTNELRAIDKLIRARKDGEADKLLKEFIHGKHSDFHMAEAYYRLGLVARREKREDDALGYWDRTYSAFPDKRGGRFAALCLADTLYAQYCDNNPKYSEWEYIRNLYSAAIGMDNAPFLPSGIRTRIIKNLNKLNGELVFGDAPTKMAEYYTIKNGDNLAAIAKARQIHYNAIERVNKINAKRIRAGQKIKILKGKCLIVVDKTALTLTWYLDGKWIKQYPCCVGPVNKTPAGTYTIETKTVNPRWTDPKTNIVYEYLDEKNILGTRWMGIKGNNTFGLGIHGTALPQSIPGRTSNGCVRLHNEDVEELYAFGLIGCKVVIIE